MQKSSNSALQSFILHVLFVVLYNFAWSILGSILISLILPIVKPLSLQDIWYPIAGASFLSLCNGLVAIIYVRKYADMHIPKISFAGMLVMGFLFSLVAIVSYLMFYLPWARNSAERMDLPILYLMITSISGSLMILTSYLLLSLKFFGENRFFIFGGMIGWFCVTLFNIGVRVSLCCVPLVR